MKISLKGDFPAKIKEQTLVVFAQNASSTKKGTSKVKIEKASAEVQSFLKGISELQDQGLDFGQSLFFRHAKVQGATHLLVIGLGEKKGTESVREAGAFTFKSLSSEKLSTAAVLFDSLPLEKAELAMGVRAFVEGAELASYKFTELKSKKDKKDKKAEVELSLYGASLNGAQAKTALSEAQILAEAVNFARWLGDMPGNYMTPSRLAEEAMKKGKSTTGLKVTVWDKARIKKERMGGLYGVSLGSAQDPRFIIMEYNGAAKGKKPVCFVGKGLTFDSGGVSIKPSQGMEEMKYDMCGGASVIAAMWAIARLKLKINAIGLVPSTENMTGGAANKPGDVLTARNGVTFEVNNTDAEGRLILADALSYASEKKPEFIADAATLTGAMVIALGNTHTGYFTRNNELKARIEKAAEQSDEWVWHMPLTDYHVKDIQGTFADFSNISSFRGAGSATAAAFLEQFVEDGIPWAHFDIAGTAWNCGNRQAYQPKKGATGAIVRTFVELARTK